MIRKAQSTAMTEVTATDGQHSSLVRAVGVGDPQEWRQQGHALPTEGLAFVAFHDVTQEMLDHWQPSVVFSPLLAKNFDCIDLAVLLHSLGYSGEYRAIAIGVPKPGVIEREVRQLCPHLKFRIVEAA